MKRVIVTCLLAGLLGAGCTWMKERWPWGGQTPPEDQTRMTIDPTAPLPATAPAEGAATAPATAGSPAEPYAGYALIGEPRVVEAFMLQVNDEIITVDEVLNGAREDLQAIADTVSEENFRRQAMPIISRELQRKVGEALLVNSAQRELTDEDKDRIETLLEAELRELTAQAGGSRSQLDQRLRQQEGIGLDEWTRMRRRQLTSQAATRKRFVPQLVVTRAQLWRYYQSHPEEFSSPRQIQMQVLAVPFRQFLPDSSRRPTDRETEAARRDARERIETALHRLRAGEDFGAVTREFGTGYHAEDGGLWDFMPAGSFREKAVEDAAFAMQPGQFSPILEGETGFFIVRTAAAREGTQVPFEQAQVEIEEKLREQQYDELSARYIGDLYNRATIVQGEAFRQVLLDQAVARFYGK